MATEKEYVKDGTIVEATSVEFKVINTESGATFVEPNITEAATLQVFDTERDGYRQVKWDFSVKPSRLFYVD